jgi:hypothetical protein
VQQEAVFCSLVCCLGVDDQQMNRSKRPSGKNHPSAKALAKSIKNQYKSIIYIFKRHFL